MPRFNSDWCFKGFILEDYNKILMNIDLLFTQSTIRATTTQEFNNTDHCDCKTTFNLRDFRLKYNVFF